MSTSNAQPATAVAAKTELRHNAVGLPGVLFQSIAMMAPAAAVSFAFFPGIATAGGSFPLAVVIALVASVLLALSIGQLAIHLPSAGGFYTYVGHGLGKSFGFLVGWLTIPVYLLFMPVNLLIFGFAAEFLVATETNGSVDIKWWIWAIPMGIIMGLLTFFGVRLSTWTLLVLGSIEVLAFLLLSIFAIAHAPDGQSAQAFTVGLSPTTDLGGWQAVLQGAVFAFTAFIGFESAAPLAEESRDPKRIVPRGIFLSALIIGLFFVLASYASVAGYGFNHIFPSSPTDTHSYVTDTNLSPVLTIATNVWGQAGFVLITLVLLNSTAANTGAGYTALGRIVYAMGRSGALPRWFGLLSKRYRTPYVVLVLGGLISLGLAFWVTAAYGPLPGNLTVILAVLTDCVLVCYIAVSLAVIFFYRREHESDFNVWLHAVIPIITTLLVLGVLIAQFYPTPPAFPGNLAAPIAAGWLVLGIIWVIVLRASRPAALEAGERLYLEA
ncbi:MAG TPA: APC family permease [Ktedonobacterales bacterium]|nr:APC family permease [Ktedonobacterales bacterium]